MGNGALGSRIAIGLAAVLPLACMTPQDAGPEPLASERSSPPAPPKPDVLASAGESTAGPATAEQGEQPPQSNYRVTARSPLGGGGPGLFMELYRGPEPGEWLATSGGEGSPRSPVSLVLPAEGTEPWLIRVDSRPPGKGQYSIAVHRTGREPEPRFGAPLADRYEGDDSWFQGTTLVLGEAQAHSLGDSANPRGDEDWFVVSPNFGSSKPAAP